jgi:probable rRNA maturation factor
LPINLSAAKKIVRRVLKSVPCQELSIYLVSESRIGSLHKKFFNDPRPTDCISFPIDSETLGEIFVCPKTAIKYATDTEGNVYEEVALYIIHGLLHLLGFDDMTANDKRIMRKKEKKCMADCKVFIKQLS